MKKNYAIILKKDKDGGYLVDIPDFNNSTYGETFDDAIEMAKDAISVLCLSLEDSKKKLPKGISVDKLIKDNINSNNVVTSVDIDTYAYRMKIENKYVRRNITLPYFLDKAARDAKINVSLFLQEHLRKDLAIA